MPKVSKKSATAAARKNPIKTAKDPKASHLYTDDNPATTVHGTGFKDRETAEKTLDLIKDRSLIYQFQTVNTMYNRAKSHPAMKAGKTDGNANMREAMDVFRDWLNDTYPKARSALRLGGFKPLLSKQCVDKYLAEIEKVSRDAHAFAIVYAKLAKGKRLGNVLVDDSKPTEPDWERKRYNELCVLVPDKKAKPTDWTADELWEKGEVGGKPSKLHLQLIGWAWSPVGESKLR